MLYGTETRALRSWFFLMFREKELNKNIRGKLPFEKVGQVLINFAFLQPARKHQFFYPHIGLLPRLLLLEGDRLLARVAPSLLSSQEPFPA